MHRLSSPTLFRYALAVVLSCVTTPARAADEAAIDRWSVRSRRLDDPALAGLPLLGTYAHPSPRWASSWHSGHDPSCARGGGGFGRYALSGWLASWMPETVLRGECVGTSFAVEGDQTWTEMLGARGWLGGLHLDGWEGTGWGWMVAGDAGSWPRIEAGAGGCKRKAVAFLRYAAEADRFPLLMCDGSVDADAVDRLSVMARPVGVARPALPLPEEPEAGTMNGEWVDSVKLVHPRLVWLMQQIADAFPGRTIYIVSGYRRGAHEAAHGEARALDIDVMGVAKERVYEVCRKLQDTGCGYYPNHEFVHVDVRAPGSGGSYWIDVSEPGERSEYVRSWPGVEEDPRQGWGRIR